MMLNCFYSLFLYLLFLYIISFLSNKYPFIQTFAEYSGTKVKYSLFIFGEKVWECEVEVFSPLDKYIVWLLAFVSGFININLRIK